MRPGKHRLAAEAGGGALAGARGNTLGTTISNEIMQIQTKVKPENESEIWRYYRANLERFGSLVSCS